MISAQLSAHLPQGTVFVGDELIRPGEPAVPCPAAPLIAGELDRLGIPTISGPLTISQDRAAGAPAAAVMFPSANSALCVAGDGAAFTEARTAVARAVTASRARTVLLASPRSFCAGVDRAIEVVEHALQLRGSPIYVRKQIVHNTHVVADLRQRGAIFVDELDEVPDQATVVFSAHGVSPAVREDAARRGLDVIDATCPLVTKVHAEARRFAARGDTVVLIGHAGHEEVEGTLGEAPARTVLVESVQDVENLEVEDPQRVSYLTQTTLAVQETTEIIDALKARFPALRGPGSDDICYATTNRQDALTAIADEADLVLVVGSANSSNSQRLVELAQRQGTPSYLVDEISDIQLGWLTNAELIGLSAGASAPPHLVQDVITVLRGLGRVTIDERTTARETIQFTLPSTLRH